MGCNQSHECRERRTSKNGNSPEKNVSNTLCEAHTTDISTTNDQIVKDRSINQGTSKRTSDDDALLSSGGPRRTSSRYKLLTPKHLVRYPSKQEASSHSSPLCASSGSSVIFLSPLPKKPYRSRGGKSQPIKQSAAAVPYQHLGNEEAEDSDFIVSSGSGSSSAPQLFHFGPTRRAEQQEGTWEWWYEQVEELRITKDYVCRTKLQDIPNRLTRQYEIDKGHVELDMGWCYMERSAPYVIGRLLASPFLNEIRWITSLRLDGNYFTAEGFGNMLAVMCESNKRRPVLPLLRYLYLNHMNLDSYSIKGIFFYLFPTDLNKQNSRIAGKAIGPPSEAYAPFGIVPETPLFPSLEVLSLCDNPGIGNQGLAELLRCLIASHFEKRFLSVVDLSRCSLDEVGVQYLREYLTLLPDMVERKKNIVFVGRFVLIGNRHSMDCNSEVCSTDDVTLIL